MIFKNFSQMNSQTEFGLIPFIPWRKYALTISIVLMLISIASLAFRGLQLGIDFTGGTLIELGYQKQADLSKLRQVIANDNFSDSEISYFGSNQEVLVRVAPKGGMSNAQISETIIQLARSVSDSEVTVRRVEFVGAKVGEELTNDGGLAVLYALIGILLYIGFRFEWRFAISSVAALVHDVVITLGVFSVFGVEFNLTVLAAILAVIGYSLNDTIVVFDRIRESFINIRVGKPNQIVNKSINDMLSRTIMTSLTTLLVLLALFILGGEIIKDFSLALLIGVVVGTYSSIYVASSCALSLGITREHMLPPKKEGDEKPMAQQQLMEQMRREKEYEQMQAAEQSQGSQSSAQSNRSDRMDPSALPNKRKATKSSKNKRRKK